MAIANLPPIPKGENQPAVNTNGTVANVGGVEGLKDVTGFLSQLALSSTPLGKMLSQYPGARELVKNLAQGNTDPTKIGRDVALTQLAGIVNKISNGLPITGLTTALAGEAFKENPNFAAAGLGSAVRTAGGMIGQAAIPIPGVGYLIGSTIADYFADQSEKDGYLGDWGNSRKDENKRDILEDDWGMDVDDTATAAHIEDAYGRYGVTDDYGIGLTEAYNSTGAGQIESAANSALGLPSLNNETTEPELNLPTLEDFLDQWDWYGNDDDDGDYNVGGDQGSSTGTGGGYNDGSGGVSGL